MISQQGQQRQELAAGVESKRAAALANKLRDTEARLADVEKQALKYAAELSRPRHSPKRCTVFPP